MSGLPPRAKVDDMPLRDRDVPTRDQPPGRKLQSQASLARSTQGLLAAAHCSVAFCAQLGESLFSLPTISVSCLMNQHKRKLAEQQALMLAMCLAMDC